MRKLYWIEGDPDPVDLAGIGAARVTLHDLRLLRVQLREHGIEEGLSEAIIAWEEEEGT